MSETPQKSRPILMSAPMVRAILEGRKTQTRRVVKKQFSGGLGKVRVDPVMWGNPAMHNGEAMFFYEAGGTSHSASPGPLCIPCPYGQSGDRLWVRETWRPLIDRSHSSGTQRYAYRADHPSPSAFDGTWKPAIHMPKAASRITLEITGVRVERLQEISEADAEREGIHPHPCGCVEGCEQCDDRSFRECFSELWDSINGKGAWDKNPWVWVLEFTRIGSEAGSVPEVTESNDATGVSTPNLPLQ